VYDRQTGLLYLRARFYDPEVGRFLSRDPVARSVGTSSYAYADNNPVSKTDPTGLLTFAVGGGFDVSFFLGVNQQISLVEDDKGNKGVAWDANVTAGLEVGATGNFTVTVTTAPTIDDLQSKGLGDYGSSLGVSGAFGIGAGTSVQFDSSGKPTGFSVSVTGGVGESAGGSLGYTNVFRVSDKWWYWLAHRLGAAGATALAFDAAVGKGNSAAGEYAKSLVVGASGVEGTTQRSREWQSKRGGGGSGTALCGATQLR
jgi:RHS repeat-associated protein